MEIKLETGDLGAYLVADEVAQSDHPRIVSLASSLTSGVESETAKAKILFEWVRDEIPHTRDAEREEVTCHAVEVLETGTGICYAKAHLLAALMRAERIPCGFCYQLIDEGGELHGLNAIYLSEFEKWIRIDPRGNTQNATRPALFELGEEIERLAFPELEFLDSIIYAKPLPSVIRALREAPTRTELWKQLPTA